MKIVRKDSGFHRLEVGETVMVSIKGKEIPCKVVSCHGTICRMCVLDSACVNWNYGISEREAAAFISLEDLVE